MDSINQMTILNHVNNIVYSVILKNRKNQLDCIYESIIKAGYDIPPTLEISFDGNRAMCLFNKNEQDILIIQISNYDKKLYVSDLVNCDCTQMLITYHKVKNKLEELLTQVKLNTNE